MVIRDGVTTLDSWLDARNSVRLVIVLGILALSLALSVYCYTGYYGTDDCIYLEGIKAVLGLRTLAPQDFGAIRLGVTAPAALSYWFSGGSIFATIASFLIYPPLLAWAAYLIGRRLHGTTTGLLAAFVTATCPLIYLEGGAILPDNATAFWCALAVLAAINAMLHGHPNRASLGRQVLWLVLAGVLLGCAYMCKESALILAVPIGLGILLARPRFSMLYVLFYGLMFALGLVIVMALEAVWLHRITGEWFLRVLTAQGENVLVLLRGRAEEQGTALWVRFETFRAVLLRKFDGTALLLMPAFFLAYLFTRPSHAGGRKASWMVFAAFLWPAVYLTYGSASWREYQFPSIKERYYAICVVPAAVMAAHVWAAMVHRITGGKSLLRVARMGVATLVLVVPPSLWAFQQLQYVDLFIGREHGAPRMRAFFYTLRQERIAHPYLPIVLSQFLSNTMRPLLPPDDQGQTVWLTRQGNEYNEGVLRRKSFILSPRRRPPMCAGTRRWPICGKQRPKASSR